MSKGQVVNSPELAMQLAVLLSKKGFPAPNPHVGCVIVKNGIVVGEGYHHFAGGPHAEVLALTDAANASNGADVYVTLEPCNHYGSTPPCSQALINAGVKRVYYAVKDPNPVAQGGGRALESAGIEVFEGLGAERASLVNDVWLTAVNRKSPFVAVKAAMSLDGRIALPNGESKWITGERSRAEGRLLRARYGAVLVGRKTIQFDDPLLTVRSKRAVNQPVRIVLDPHRRLSDNMQVFNGDAPYFRVVTNPKGESEVECEIKDGSIDLGHLLSKLYSKGIKSILVEGGGKTISHFLESNLVDRIHLIMAGKVLMDGATWASGNWVELAKVKSWHLMKVCKYGPDVELVYDSEMPSEFKG